MRDVRGQLAGDLVVYEPFNLWGSVAGHVRVVQGGKLYVRGAIYGDLLVEYGGRVHIFGRVAGTLTVQRGAKVVHSGIVAGDAINDGGRLYVDAQASINGKLRTRHGQTNDRRSEPGA